MIKRQRSLILLGEKEKRICLQASALPGEFQRDLSSPAFFNVPAVPEICEIHWAVSILPAVHKQQALKFCLCLLPQGPQLWQTPGGTTSGAHSSFAVRRHSSCETKLGCLLPKGKKFRYWWLLQGWKQRSLVQREEREWEIGEGTALDYLLKQKQVGKT